MRTLKYHSSIAIIITLLITSCTTQESNQWDKVKIDKELSYCVDKSKHLLLKMDDYTDVPKTILEGEKEWKMKKHVGWCSGFWSGILWYAYEASGDEAIKKEADLFSKEIEVILTRPVKSHDLGFVFNSSFGNAYRLTKKEKYKEVLLEAADSLTTLFNPNVGTILSWPAQVRKKVYYPHNTIIDNMLNLELLFRATEYSGDSTYYNIAVKHAQTTIKNHIRPDYTTYHVVVYDDKTGEKIKGVTHQGYADNSMWARGQSWGVYGYAMCYRETGKKEFLETAKKLADVYLSRLPEDYIPFWDFDDPGIPNVPRDASAAAVTASALIELSQFVEDDADKNRYRMSAEKMLMSLSSANYQSREKNDAFLSHSTGSIPKGYEVDAPIIYADYYYIEALLRLKRLSQDN
jgi:unsaturated chondroitin disaccharide hydrolase